MTHLPDRHADLMPAKIVYGLYAIGYLVGLTTIVGVIYAYMARGRDAVLDTHLRFQIRTFWISLALSVVAFLTMWIGVGLIIWGFLAVWGLIRVISGFVLAHEGKPVTGTKYLGILAV